MRGLRGMYAAAVVAAVMGAASDHGQAAALKNDANEYLLHLAPQERAAWLARTVGEWCIATDPFEMGVSDTGPSAGNAYWSFRCVNGGSYIVQLDRGGHGVAVDCETFKRDAAGKECFKKF